MGSTGTCTKETGIMWKKKTMVALLKHIKKKIKNNINRMIDNSTKNSLLRDIQVFLTIWFIEKGFDNLEIDCE
jgi:hypothetical protein